MSLRLNYACTRCGWNGQPDPPTGEYHFPQCPICKNVVQYVRTVHQPFHDRQGHLVIECYKRGCNKMLHEFRDRKATLAIATGKFSCPNCGHNGAHIDNGGTGEGKIFTCRGCGNHHDASIIASAIRGGIQRKL